ncbi:tyrosine-type recombinase/integrase [Tropicimonas sp. IMCC6043]|uniref:tyrosine-type recombinase/integrase n=1 Tax=Tropicimonas sp. IMCC6043 TaxID=2510645 RepID=UPI00101BCB7E|nr:tyrosine-type recombinase/integrase [Tropicimonas sp. IMCC6043]RYH06514.1 hypothetical protein EU800_23535 [Tropicimonas sp. IMCC6043]
MTNALTSATQTQQPAVTVPSDLSERFATYAEMSRGAFSKNTERAIASDTRIFTAWCEKHGAVAVPADPQTLAAFVREMGEVRKPATVSRYVSSIDHMHRAVDLTPPGATNAVRLALRRLRRDKGTRQDQAKPLRWSTIQKALDLMGDDLDSLRDAALICLAYDTFARASELVAFRLRDIQQDDDGNSSAFIARSKTDQEGEGDFRFVSASTYARIMAWVRAWEALSHERMGKNDPLFPPLGFNAKNPAIGTRDVTEILKRRCGSVYSAHSTRVGAAQDAMTVGATTPQIQQSGGWKSERMVLRYGGQVKVKESAAAMLAQVQGR